MILTQKSQPRKSYSLVYALVTFTDGSRAALTAAEYVRYGSRITDVRLVGSCINTRGCEVAS